MSFQGKFLVARPVLKDPVFGSKVILISRFDGKTGTEGFILNGPVVGKVVYGELKGEDTPEDRDEVKALVESGKMDAAMLYSGGPCRSPGIYMIHGYKSFLEAEKEKGEFQLGSTIMDDAPEDKTITEGVYYGTPALMAKIIMEDKIAEGKFRFFNGIAGWSPGQLEREIEAGAWEVIDAEPDAIFNVEKADELVARLHNRQAKEFIRDILDDDELPPFRIPEPSVN